MKIRRLSKHDFGTPRTSGDPPLYDLEFDAVLIQQSIATQYGILPMDQGELPWPEWKKLVNGLMDDTPLGRVVAVRGEQDRKVIARMSPWQRNIRAQWSAFLAEKTVKESTPDQLRSQMAGLEKTLAKLFGGEQNA